MSKETLQYYVIRRLSKYDMSPSALALSYYYVGGTGRFKELRSQAEYHRKNYYSNKCVSNHEQSINRRRSRHW